MTVPLWLVAAWAAGFLIGLFVLAAVVIKEESLVGEDLEKGLGLLLVMAGAAAGWPLGLLGILTASVIHPIRRKLTYRRRLEQKRLEDLAKDVLES